jgi:phospholipid/cholesterol/gamma-HCH transport system substrate-binding protein
VLNEISPKVNGKSNLNIDFVITLQGPKPALEYRSPLPLPTVGSVPACPGISMPVAANGTTSTLSAQSVDAPLPSQTPAPPVALRNTSQRGPLSNPVNWLIYVPPLIALAILIKVMGGAIPLLRPRSLRIPGRRNRDRTTEGE